MRDGFVGQQITRLECSSAVYVQPTREDAVPLLLYYMDNLSLRHHSCVWCFSVFL